jgi:hypothetical protein
VLAGTSELDFLLEFICERHGLAFARTADKDRARTFSGRAGVVILYAEDIDRTQVPQNAASLREIIS